MQMNTCRKLLIATAIHLYWWQMRALSKYNDPFNQLGWSAADQAATIKFEIAAQLAPSILHSDLMGRQDRSKNYDGV